MICTYPYHSFGISSSQIDRKQEKWTSMYICVQWLDLWARAYLKSGLFRCSQYAVVSTYQIWSNAVCARPSGATP